MCFDNFFTLLLLLKKFKEQSIQALERQKMASQKLMHTDEGLKHGSKDSYNGELIFHPTLPSLDVMITAQFNWH